MATADLRTLDGCETEPMARACCPLADRVFDVSAMAGAAAGAWAGAAVSAAAFPGAHHALLGTLGVVVGSVLAALVARYVVLPFWVGSGK